MNLPTGDGWRHWPAPAKLNLYLAIVGRRADGYHQLQTLFQLLDWGDTVAIRVRDDEAIVRHAGAAGVAAEQDLVVRAARALQQATGCRRGADLAVGKRIPQGGGFGGGSSDAATVLRVLNRLWATGLDLDRLAELALSLGADVPLFVRGHSAWAEGIGERLTPVALPPRHFLLLDSGVQVPTAELFQAPDLTRNARPLRMPAPENGWPAGNAFEPVLRARAPRIDAALRALSCFGPAQLTGSGGGCFVAFDDAAAAETARAALADQWSVCCARGVDVSPLHAALARDDD